MLSTVEILSQFKQQLIREAFNLDDVQLVKEINELYDNDLLLLLVNAACIKQAAELAIDNVKKLKEPNLPF